MIIMAQGKSISIRKNLKRIIIRIGNPLYLASPCPLEHDEEQDLRSYWGGGTVIVN